MQDKYIAKRKKGKHLTLAERAKIEVYLKENKTEAYIAEKIGVSERTIYREINRGQWEQQADKEVYSQGHGHRKLQQKEDKRDRGLYE